MGEHWRSLTAQVLMTKDPICCAPTDILSTAARLMAEHNIGCVPIVKYPNKELLGIITDRDIALAIGRGMCKETPVSAVVPIGGEMLTVKADTDYPHIIQGMMDWMVRRVPVVDDANRVAGIISVRDLLNLGGVNGIRQLLYEVF